MMKLKFGGEGTPKQKYPYIGRNLSTNTFVYFVRPGVGLLLRDESAEVGVAITSGWLEPSFVRWEGFMEVTYA